MTSSAGEYFLDFIFKQTNLLYIRDLLRYTAIYKPDTLFVILGMKNVLKTFTNYQIHPDLISDGIITSSTRFIIGNRETFLKLCNSGREVHMLEFDEENSCFKWLEATVGANVAVFRKHTMTDLTTHIFDKVDIKYDRPVTIIFSGYGMGKTTCLKQISENLINQNKKNVILFLNEVMLQKFCINFPSQNIESFLKFFDLDLSNSNIHIMYDNFEHLKECDDLISIMNEFHLNYRHVQQWITCSKIESREKLEAKFGTFALYLGAPSVESQLLYLKTMWGVENDEYDEYIKSILNRFDSWYWNDICKLTWSTDNIKFSNYPLHLKMIGSMFKPSDKSQSKEEDILDLYEHSVKCFYNNTNIEELAVLKLFEYVNYDFKFKNNEIVISTTATFDYVNVTNFLAAKWFSKNFRDYQDEFKCLIQSNVCSWSFQYFFNSFLSRGKLLHTAVLNRWRIFDICTEANINEKDSGGRIALHLTDNVYLIRQLLDRDSDMECKDDVLQWTPIQYCDCNGYLNCLNVLLDRNADDKNLTWTLSLSELAISKRFEFATTTFARLVHYTKFICKNFTSFQVSPHTLGEVFFDIPLDVIMMILNHAKKSNYFYINNWGKTALFYAVEYNNFDAVKCLINKLGFDIHHRCYENQTPFHVACQKGHIHIAEYFLNLGVDVNITHGDNTSNSFTDCCKNNNVQVMDFLITRGIDTNIISTSGITPLELACNNGSRDVVQYLFEREKDLNITYDVDYLKLLHGAIISYNAGLVEFVLKQKKINVNRKINGKTALHLACKNTYGDDELTIIKVLLQAGADVNATDNEGCTPVFETFASANIKLFKILADSGCNFSHINDDGETPLHVFTKNCLEVDGGSQHYYFELTDLIMSLITYGAMVNYRTPSGDTPLHFASLCSNLAVVRCLVIEGADINATNNNGETPLHLACLKKCTQSFAEFKTCQYLVYKGADVNKRTNSGKTPIMYAVSYPANIDVLLLLGADIFCKDNDKKTLVHYFAEYGLLKQLKILAKLGMKDAMSVDSSGRTALHYASKKKHFLCFKLLIKEFDTDINIVDTNLNTAVNLEKDT